MAALGAPIAGDPLYPVVAHRTPGDFAAPLQLLANALAFADPLGGEPRRFESPRRLSFAPGAPRPFSA